MPTTPTTGTILHCLTIRAGLLTVSAPEKVAPRSNFALSEQEFMFGGSRCHSIHVWHPDEVTPIAGLPTNAPLPLAECATAFLYCRPEHLTDAARAIRRAYYDAALVQVGKACELADRLRFCALEAQRRGLGGNLND